MARLKSVIQAAFNGNTATMIEHLTQKASLNHEPGSD